MGLKTDMSPYSSSHLLTVSPVSVVRKGLRYAYELRGVIPGKHKGRMDETNGTCGLTEGSRY